MLDVGLPGAGKALQRVGAIDAAELGDDLGLHRLGIGIVPG